MQLILDLPVAINLLSGILALSVLTYLYGRKPARGIRALRLLMASLAWWAIFNAIELAVPNTQARIWLSKISYFGIAAASPAWVSFALAYRQRTYAASRWVRAAIWGSTVYVLLAVFTNEWHHLVWVSTVPDPALGGRIVYRHGPALFAYAAMAYAMLFIGAAVLVRASLSDKSLHRRQTSLMVAAAVFPLVGNAAYLLRMLPVAGLDPTPILFILSGVLIALAIRRYRLFDLLPVARERLFDAMNVAVFVLNREGQLADMNRHAREWLVCDDARMKWLGEKPERAFPLLAPVIDGLAAIHLPAGEEMVGEVGFAPGTQGGPPDETRDSERRRQRDEALPRERGTVQQLADGRWFVAVQAPLLDESGHQEGYLLTLQDITRPKENELQLQRDKQLLEEARVAADEANQAKRVFLTNMSHEMRTPLMAISGYLSLLTSEPLSALQRQHAQEIGVASDALLSLVNEMLDLSRIEAGRMELERMPFRMDVLVEECASLLAVRLLDRPVDLVFETSVPAPLVVGDRGRVRQMILNLVGNAVKFTENGAIHLILREAASAELPDPSGDMSLSVGGMAKQSRDVPKHGDMAWIALEVRDTGPGIAEEVQPRLFEPFVQANADISRRYGGSGLGLAITARIAQAMGGVVRLESWPGLGSAFTLVLPFPILSLAGEGLCPLLGERVLVHQGVLRKVAAARVPVDDGAADVMPALLDDVPPVLLDDAPDGAAAGKDAADSDVAGRNDVNRQAVTESAAHILLVEDTQANLRLMTHLLERMGYRVTSATTGLEAVDLYGMDPPDLILMDIQMPVMDGMEATRFIRSLEQGQGRVPIVAMTANAMEGERQACYDAGMDDFLSKPVKPAVLAERVRHWLAR